MVGTKGKEITVQPCMQPSPYAVCKDNLYMLLAILTQDFNIHRLAHVTPIQNFVQVGGGLYSRTIQTDDDVPQYEATILVPASWANTSCTCRTILGGIQHQHALHTQCFSCSFRRK